MDDSDGDNNLLSEFNNSTDDPEYKISQGLARPYNETFGLSEFHLDFV